MVVMATSLLGCFFAVVGRTMDIYGEVVGTSSKMLSGHVCKGTSLLNDLTPSCCFYCVVH